MWPLSQKFKVPESYTQMGPRLLSLVFEGLTIYLQVFYLFRLIFELFPLRIICFWSGFKLNTISQMTPKGSATCQPYHLFSECSHQRPSHCLKSHCSHLNTVGLKEFFQSFFFHLLQICSSIGFSWFLIHLSIFLLSLFVLSLHSFSNQQTFIQHLLWTRHHVKCQWCRE